jgi:hypothetical protein
MGADDNAVGTDLDRPPTNVSGLKSGDIEAVQNDLSRASNDLSTLKNLGAT